MSSSHAKRLGDAPLLSRVRELFRKKRNTDSDGQDLRELLKENHESFFRELERLLESQKAQETSASHNEPQISLAYCTVSTQTELLEELAPEDTQVDGPSKEKPEYVSSSTQVEVEMEDKGVSVVISDFNTPSPIDSSDVGDSGLIEDQGPDCKVTHEYSTKTSAFPQIWVPIEVAQNYKFLPPYGAFSNEALRMKRQPDIVRTEKRHVDIRTGTSWLWKQITIHQELATAGWRKMAVRVCLRPQTLQAPKPTSEWRTLPLLSPISDEPAPDIRKMRKVFQVWEDGGHLIISDDEKVNDCEKYLEEEE